MQMQKGESKGKYKQDFLLILNILIITFMVFGAEAQIAIGNLPGQLYTQDFNGLANSGASTIPWDNGITLSSWYAATSGGLMTSYKVSNGSSSSATLFSFGSTNDSDRAFGAVNSDATGDIAYGCLFSNTTGAAIRSVTISFDGEQWKRAQSSASTKGFQRLKISYRIGSSLSMTEIGITESTNYVDVPEAYFTSSDTVYAVGVTAINGNAVRQTIQVTFPITILANDQFFLRFYDTNETGFDNGIAIDNLSVQFSTTAVNLITAQSTLSGVPNNRSIYPYLEQGILVDIPANGIYIEPNAGHLSDWNTILNRFYMQDWGNVDASAYDYKLVHYFDMVYNLEYYVLRKESFSEYFWGTYVQCLNPTNSKLVLQAPHPIDDYATERQATGVFQFSGASHLMIAGISRCSAGLNNYSSCSGTTSICGVTDEQYRKSDVAHNISSIFHLATSVLGPLQTSKVFVQLHGFTQDTGDPDFIVSCGTANGLLKSIPDYSVMLRESILATDPNWKVKIAHIDDYDVLGGSNNVQGRLLNAYSNDICAGTTKPTTVTNRYLHIEQYRPFRKFVSYYDDMAAMIGSVINDSPYNRQVPITSMPFAYSQNFNSLVSAAPIPTWGNHLHIPGWHVANSVKGLFGTYSIDNGTSSTGGLYSFGTTGSNDRAIGTINDASTDNIAYGILFKNTCGIPISHVTLSYHGEQWRKEAASVQRVKLSYIIANQVDLSPTGILNNALFTNVPSGDFQSLDDNTSSGSLDGNAATNSATMSSISIAVNLDMNQELFIRFYDDNAAGPDKGFAVDDVVITFDNEPLVVRWEYFNVKKKNGMAQLLWAASKEDECERYEVLRSFDGMAFSRVATIDCQHRTPLNQYEYFDIPPPGATHVYYQIAQYDYNGDLTYSTVQPFLQKSLAEPVIAYKKGTIEIINNNEESIRSVRVYDLLGRLVCEGEAVRNPGNVYIMNCTIRAEQIVAIKIDSESGIFTKRILIREQ